MSMELLRTDEAARLIGVSPKTLQVWRFFKKGPPWVTTDGYHVRYERNELVEWLALRPVKNDAHIRTEHGQMVS